ncbi:MAG: MFS transporter [Gammaproteobacteria bacterium]|nr:MFS transporter [Gammaproteobacteria bacterium]
MNKPFATMNTGKNSQSPLPTKTPRNVLILLCLLYLLLYIDRVNIGILAPLIRADLGLSNTQMGMVFSAFSIPYAFFQLFGGWLADRFGARLVLATCCVIAAISTVLTGLTGGFISLIAARIALGFGEGPAFPTATRAMSTWTPAEKWGFAQGITHSCARIGNAITPPLVAGILIFASWRTSFILLGSITFLWSLAWLFYFRDDPKTHKSISAGDLARLPKPAVKEKTKRKVPYLRLARHILPVTMVDFCYGWTLWLFLSWIPTFFFENYGLNLRDTALFSAGVLFAGVIGDTLGGILSDSILRRTGSLLIARRSVLVLGFSGAALFLIPVILIPDLTVSAICLSLAFFFAELIVAPIWAVPMDIAPRYAGSASGMMNFGFGLAGLVSPASFGYFVDLTGSWVMPFIGSILLLLIGAILAARLRPDRQFTG